MSRQNCIALSDVSFLDKTFASELSDGRFVTLPLLVQFFTWFNDGVRSIATLERQCQQSKQVTDEPGLRIIGCIIQDLQKSQRQKVD